MNGVIEIVLVNVRAMMEVTNRIRKAEEFFEKEMAFIDDIDVDTFHSYSEELFHIKEAFNECEIKYEKGENVFLEVLSIYRASFGVEHYIQSMSKEDY